MEIFSLGFFGLEAKAVAFGVVLGFVSPPNEHHFPTRMDPFLKENMEIFFGFFGIKEKTAVFGGWFSF